MKYKGHLRKIDPVTGAIDPHEGWIVNNQILYSDDNFKTSETALGEFTIGDQTFYGLLAQAMFAGYIEGSTIVGGTINIGNGAFVVHSDGTVTMNAIGNVINGYAKEEDVAALKDTATIISDIQPSSAKEGQLWLNTSTDPYSLMIFTDGKWVYFSQKNGETIYITRPESYQKGDLWIVNESDDYNICSIVNEAASSLLEEAWNNNTVYYTKNGIEIKKLEYTPYEGTDKTDLGNYTVGEDGFFHYNIYTSYDSATIPDPAIMYHQGFFGSVGFNANNFGDSITIYDKDGNVICSQDNIKYYGTDTLAEVKLNADAELYLIYSNGQMYLLKKYVSNSFFCEQTHLKFINGTILKAIESSSVFNYDHWVDITPENTEMQNNIYQNFTFNKNSGLTIGQTDNAFYVNLNSQEMGFYDNSDSENPHQKVVSIGNKSATIQNAVFQGSDGTQFENPAIFENQVSMVKADTEIGFAWKVEQNGSLSLAIIS